MASPSYAISLYLICVSFQESECIQTLSLVYNHINRSKIPQRTKNVIFSRQLHLIWYKTLLFKFFTVGSFTLLLMRFYIWYGGGGVGSIFPSYFFVWKQRKIVYFRKQKFHCKICPKLGIYSPVNSLFLVWI